MLYRWVHEMRDNFISFVLHRYRDEKIDREEIYDFPRMDKEKEEEEKRFVHR